MTPEQKMNTLMLELGELLRTKNTDISLKTWQLEQANKEIASYKEIIAKLEEENKLLEDALHEAEAEIDRFKEGVAYVD